jgi:phosphoglycerol transferase MdoB-like AlkP superfamily enzyme
MFIVGFIFSFLFNWLGLLLSFCVMHTCAGRFGALAGFGLSIVKWVLIVKSNDWATGVADDDSWIWWLMMAFGMLISCSGFLHYISIKQKWSRKRYTFII